MKKKFLVQTHDFARIFDFFFASLLTTFEKEFLVQAHNSAWIHIFLPHLDYEFKVGSPDVPWVKWWSKAMDFLQTFFLDKYFLSPISEKTFILEQSLKLTHNFTSSFIPRPVTHEKLFLQRYGEQSVPWQLCAPYRYKNKCLGGVCFYSDMEHKSNNMIKNDKMATKLWSFKFRNFLAKTMISKRSKYPFQDFFFCDGLKCLVNFYIR